MSDERPSTITGTSLTLNPDPSLTVTTTVRLTEKELEMIEAEPVCEHGRRSGAMCPWCIGIN